MKHNFLSTQWGEAAGEGIPLNEYPRPQLVRDQWLNLNGTWDYAVTNREEKQSQSFPREKEGAILVPFSIETSLSGVGRPLNPDEYLWYRRTFKVPAQWKDMNIRLNFEAVDWLCECFINGKSAGLHRGGYIPFSFDITGFLIEGENSLEVRVEDPTDSGPQQRGKQVLQPKSIYYEATSGIWQTVWLEPVPAEGCLDSFSCIPDFDSDAFRIRTEGSVNEDPDLKLEAELLYGGESLAAVRGTCGEELILPVENPHYWSPEDPHLYDLSLKLINEDGAVIDKVQSYTAMRKVSRINDRRGYGRIAINDKPVFLHGPLDQGYWPESGMTAPADDALVFDIEKMKDLGFNMIRKHIKVESRRWYYHADRLGMTVIQDMVSGGEDWGQANPLYMMGMKVSDCGERRFRKARRHDPQVRDDFRNELKEMIALLGNHPSVVCWVPFNESWGQFEALSMSEMTKEIDPSRLVDHASGWVDQGGGDFYSVHRYVLKLKKMGRKEKRIHMISEYGGYNLKVPGHMWNDDKKYGYRSYKTEEIFNRALGELFEDQLLPLVSKGLSAAVYTQLSDVEIESNGFYTYDRKVLKCDARMIRELNDKIYREFDKISDRTD